MKKIIKLLLIGCGFFYIFKNNVKAKTFELEASPEQVTYMIEKGPHKFQLYFHLIRDRETKEYVYCLEPGVALSSEEYEELKEIEYSKLNLSEEIIDEITHIAYFGYNDTTHQNRNYYYAAQLLIWEKIIPEDWRIYYTNGLGKEEIKPYQMERQEIMKQIEEDQKQPSFANQTFSWLSNNPLLLKDTTNTLNHYQILDNKQLEVVKKDNVLEIKSTKEQEVTLEFVKNYEGKPLQFYYRADGQNTLMRGALTNKTFQIHLKPVETEVKITKIDEDGIALENVTFRLLKQNSTEMITEEKTDEFGRITFKNLDFGTYCLEEQNTPNDYIPLSEPVCFELSQSNPKLSLPITNQKKRSKLIIQKLDAENKNILEKVRFQVWYKDTCLIDDYTNEFGLLELDNLVNGEYKIIEIETLDGYQLEKEPLWITIDGTTPVITTTIYNRKLENVPNTLEQIENLTEQYIINEERKKKK